MWDFPLGPVMDLDDGLAELGFMYDSEGGLVIPELKTAGFANYTLGPCTLSDEYIHGREDWLPAETIAGRRLPKDLLDLFHPDGKTFRRPEPGRVACFYRGRALAVPEYALYKQDGAIWAAIRFQYYQTKKC